jgi:hypothetical protein
MFYHLYSVTTLLSLLFIKILKCRLAVLPSINFTLLV